MTRITSYFKCPDCGKRGVTLRIRRNGEDHMGCRYCKWFAYTYGGAKVDVDNIARLDAANPEVES